MVNMCIVHIHSVHMIRVYCTNSWCYYAHALRPVPTQVKMREMEEGTFIGKARRCCDIP